MSDLLDLNKISQELFETQSEWSPEKHRKLEDIQTVTELNDFLFHNEHSLKKTVKSNIKLLDRYHQGIDPIEEKSTSQGSLKQTTA